MRGFLARGARMSWPHLPRISHQTMVERSLQSAALSLGVEVSTPKLSFTERGRASRWAAMPRGDALELPPSSRVPSAAAAAGGGGGKRGSSGQLLLPQVAWRAPALIANALGVDFSQLMAGVGLGSLAPSRQPPPVPPPPPSTLQARSSNSAAARRPRGASEKRD